MYLKLLFLHILQRERGEKEKEREREEERGGGINVHSALTNISPLCM